MQGKGQPRSFRFSVTNIPRNKLRNLWSFPGANEIVLEGRILSFTYPSSFFSCERHLFSLAIHLALDFRASLMTWKAKRCGAPEQSRIRSKPSEERFSKTGAAVFGFEGLSGLVIQVWQERTNELQTRGVFEIHLPPIGRCQEPI